MSNAARTLCVPSWATPRTIERATLGAQWAVLAERMGNPYMPWQRQVADVAGELDPRTGLLVYRKVIVTVPRQSGKTTLIVPVFTHRCVAWPVRRSQRCLYTAQTRLDAKSKWAEHIELLDDTPALRGVYRVDKSHGAEQIVWRNRSSWGLMATTKKSGHGKTLDLGAIDEAFAQTDWRVEQAMSPAMVTRADAQLWVLSTAGDETSVYLNANVDDGRARVDADERSGVAYFEWSAAEDADPADTATWWSCMPALGVTVNEETIAAEYDKLRDQPSEFRRAYLNLRAGATSGVIPALQWSACIDEGTMIDHVRGEVSIGIEVSHDRSSSAITAAGRLPDGRLHVEVIKQGPGTSWVVDDVVTLCTKHRLEMVVVDAQGPARSLVKALTFALQGWPDLLQVIGTGEVVGACGAFVDDVADRRIAQLDQPELNAAVAAAGKRMVNDSFVFSRRASMADISPLVAATLATWAARQPPRQGGIH